MADDLYLVRAEEPLIILTDFSYEDINSWKSRGLEFDSLHIGLTQHRLIMYNQNNIKTERSSSIPEKNGPGFALRNLLWTGFGAKG